jgi:hypothetical protein
VKGNAGVIVMPREKPFAVVAFTISDGRIAEIDVIADPAKLPGRPAERPRKHTTSARGSTDEQNPRPENRTRGGAQRYCFDYASERSSFVRPRPS